MCPSQPVLPTFHADSAHPKTSELQQPFATINQESIAIASSPSAPSAPSAPSSPPSSTSLPSLTSPPSIPTPMSPHFGPLNIVVTGGSSGIGAATVRAFTKAGHRVLFTYLRGAHRAKQLKNLYPSATPVQLDQACINSVAAFALVAARWAGSRGIHVLINNAALGSASVHGYVDEQSLEEESCVSSDDDESYKKLGDGDVTPSSNSIAKLMQRAARDEALMRVNALGPLWVTDALMDQLYSAADGSGRAAVLFVGSVGGGLGVFPEYCPADLMSKAALTYLSKHIAARYVREPIDVMCVSPGACETEMFRKSTLSKVSDVKSFVDGMPKRRLIQPEELAGTVVWLATESPAGLFHGANIDASMGLAVRPGLQTETENNR